MFAVILKMTNMIEYHEYNSKPYHPGEHMRMIDIKRFERRYYVKSYLERTFQTAMPPYIIWPDTYQKYLDAWVDSEYWRPGAKIPKWFKAACIRLVLFEKAMSICSEALQTLTTISMSQHFIGGNHNEENNTETEEMGN